MVTQVSVWKSQWCQYICEDRSAVKRHEASFHEEEGFDHEVNMLLGLWEIKGHITLIPEEMFNWPIPIVREALARFRDGWPMVTYRYKVLEEQWDSGILPLKITPSREIYGRLKEEFGMLAHCTPPESVMEWVSLPPNVTVFRKTLWGHVYEFHKVKRMLDFVECMTVPPRILLGDGTQ